MKEMNFPFPILYQISLMWEKQWELSDLNEDYIMYIARPTVRGECVSECVSRSD